MHTLSYQLTTTLLNNITQIERLYGQLEALNLPQRLQLNLIQHNLVKSSYASNKIEGNPLTLPEVTNLLLDDRVPVNRDEKEVVNYFKILQNLDSLKKLSLSVDLLTTLHKDLLTGIDKTAGQIRDVPVVVGKYNSVGGSMTLKVKHNPPFHKRTQIVEALQQLLNSVDKNQNLPAVIQTGLFHHEFVYIHPFEDGNGRVCRLMNSLLFIKRGYLINHYFILDDYYDIDRQQYSDKLHSADDGNKTEWLEYYSDGVKYSLQSALARSKEALLTLRIEDQPSPKEREVLRIIQERREVKSQDMVRELRISRQQAHNLLKALVDKNLIAKKGSTKNSYYFIKE